MSKSILLSICMLLLAAFCVDFAIANEAVDSNENCEFWASVGECSKNPNYMLKFCTKSCNASKSQQLKNVPKSFYAIEEKDIHGNLLDFERFRGKVVYVVNVASFCGYTESNYRQIRELQKYYDQGFEIILSPCNSFGQQEPGNNVEIYNFADKQGFSGILLSKAEVNGEDSRELFRFLKSRTGKSHITW
jgi:glutathione peroxidase